MWLLWKYNEWPKKFPKPDFHTHLCMCKGEYRVITKS